MSLINKMKNNSLVSNRDNLMEEFFNNEFFNGFARGTSIPAMNVKDLEEKYLVEIAAPGMKKEDFSIEIDNNRLEISAEAKEETKIEKDGYTRREFGYKTFKRAYDLPENIKKEEIKAKYNDGILTIDCPKKEIEKRETQKIDIL